MIIHHYQFCKWVFLGSMMGCLALYDMLARSNLPPTRTKPSWRNGVRDNSWLLLWSSFPSCRHRTSFSNTTDCTSLMRKCSPSCISWMDNSSGSCPFSFQLRKIHWNCLSLNTWTRRKNHAATLFNFIQFENLEASMLYSWWGILKLWESTFFWSQCHLYLKVQRSDGANWPPPAEEIQDHQTKTCQHY